MSLSNPLGSVRELGSEADENEQAETSIFAEINITPFTDVILVLLIIFMVSSSVMVDAVREGQLEVDLPTAKASRALKGAAPARQVIISIDIADRLFLNGEELTLPVLKKKLQALYGEQAETAIIIDADGGLQHRQVIAVIDTVREVGFKVVGLGTGGSARGGS